MLITQKKKSSTLCCFFNIVWYCRCIVIEIYIFLILGSLCPLTSHCRCIGTLALMYIWEITLSRTSKTQYPDIERHFCIYITLVWNGVWLGFTCFGCKANDNSWHALNVLIQHIIFTQAHKRSTTTNNTCGRNGACYKRSAIYMPCARVFVLIIFAL